MLFLQSEVGELSRALLEANNFGMAPRAQVQRAPIGDRAKHIGDECADIIWNICALAESVSIDLNMALRNKMDELDGRSWSLPDPRQAKTL